jgi:pyruvate dehydrogenase E2 component (dihydrolipoamide acetyltransferase)
MYWPTESHAVPLEELGRVNTTYLAASSSPDDPTMVWGTTVETEFLTQFVIDQRKATGTLISTSHVLIRAVVVALQRHPALNRRVVGRRAYPYDGVHITMPMLETRSGEVNSVYLRHAEQMSLAEIARALWDKARDAAVRAASADRAQQPPISLRNRLALWLRHLQLHWVHRMAPVAFFVTNRWRLPTLACDEINGSTAFVNHLGFPGAPPMIAYKPSSLPTNSFGVSVTLGPAEPRPVVDGQDIVVRSVAPLFVRVDHRLVNGYQAAGFINTLRSVLHNPQALVAPACQPESRAA